MGNVEQTASFSQNYFTFEMSFRFGGRHLARAPAVTPWSAAAPAS